MSTELLALRVGVLGWTEQDGIARSYSEQLSHLGHTPINFLADARLPEHLDVVLAWGPLGSLVPLAQQLHVLDLGRRPRFALIMTEQLPNPDLPEWWRYWLGVLKSHLERQAYVVSDGIWQVHPALRWLTWRGKRYRYYGDLFWLKRQGLLSALAIWSHWMADYLTARGFQAFVPRRGYVPSWGRDLNLERDIPVLWLGKIGSRRRGRLLTRLRRQLQERGVEMWVIDGVEHPYVFGDERTVLLNRTKIVLNLLRQKWDDNSMRFELAAYNRAMIITEPMLPHTSYRPGVHLIEAPLDQLADTICYYLENNAERERIASQAHRFVTNGQPQGRAIADILERAMTAGGTQPA